jgi:allantoin racemase
MVCRDPSLSLVSPEEVVRMRILVANVAAADEDTEVSHIFKSVAVPLFRKSFDLTKHPDTELVFRFPRRGLSNLEAQPYGFFHSLSDCETLYMVMQAEREGFDGIIACFDDPTLWSARQAVDIPVVAFGESSLFLAVMMGLKFGLFCPSPLGVPAFEEKIVRYGLKDRCADVAGGYLSAADQERAMFDARPAIEEFIDVGRQLIAKGAEVLVPGCGLIAPCLRFAPGCEADYPGGLTHVDGVPIVDIYGATVNAVETLVEFKRAGSPWISRACLFARASDEALEGARSVLEYTGPGFWDC